jgi:hypothetical protein
MAVVDPETVLDQDRNQAHDQQKQHALASFHKNPQLTAEGAIHVHWPLVLPAREICHHERPIKMPPTPCWRHTSGDFVRR